MYLFHPVYLLTIVSQCRVGKSHPDFSQPFGLTFSTSNYRGNSIASTARMSNDPRSKPRDRYLFQEHHEAIVDENTFIAVAEEKKRRSNIESDENGIRRKKTRYVAKAQIDEQNNQE